MVSANALLIWWAVRLLRREWRQQLLILALITVAVGATLVASTVATDTPAPVASVLGTAQDSASLTGTPATINAEVKDIESRYGRADVIENESVQIPGTRSTFDLRAQDPHGPFGGPLLSLASGRYPTAAGQVAVTSGVAADFRLSIGSRWTVAGKTWEVTGIVANPQSLLDEFALVIPGQVTDADNVTVLFNAPGRTADDLRKSTGLTVTTAQTAANSNAINPETISVAAAVLGMLLIALVGIGISTALAVVATCFAASQPAKAIAGTQLWRHWPAARPPRERPAAWRSRSALASSSPRSSCSAPPARRAGTGTACPKSSSASSRSR